LTLECQEQYIPMKVERDIFAESTVTAQNMPLQPVERPVSGRRQRLVRAVYLAAIASATLGWLWLIAWIALQLV
jgi:hypothetical protein